MIYQSHSHEWVRVENKIATIGLTPEAQKEIGTIVFVDMPKVGKILSQGEEALVLESTKAAIDSYAPLSGKVVAINEAVLSDPSLINRDPEGGGWLYQLEMTAPEQLQELLKP